MLCQKGQGRLQWFDGNSFSVAAPADRSDVQAQQGVRKSRSVAQLQQLPSQINPADLRLHESRAGAIAELTQVDLNVFLLFKAGDQGRHHSGVKR